MFFQDVSLIIIIIREPFDQKAFCNKNFLSIFVVLMYCAVKLAICSYVVLVGCWAALVCISGC